MIPDSQQNYNDLIDVVIQSAQKQIPVKQEDGSIENQHITDEEILWWKTNEVNSNSFARFAFELKEWERMASECFNHMTDGRARKLSEEILLVSESFRRSIDAKSSESIRDKYNAKSTLIDKLGRNRVEKVYSLKQDTKKGLLDGLLGKKQQDEIEND